MSHPITTHDVENEYPEDEMSFSQAIDEVYDPYKEVVRDNMESIMRDQLERSYEYAN